MFNYSELIKENIKIALSNIYSIDIDTKDLQLQKTRKEFVGDLTWVTFPFTKSLKKSPDQIALEVGEFLLSNCDLINSFSIVKGFLNIEIKDSYWFSFLNNVLNQANYGFCNYNDDETTVIEFSSPNTNKPLHLGHIRNNLLGNSISRIIEASGKKVAKVNLINDRGIHICKSMLAWERWGKGETPESSGIKGDHLVGKYYVLFDKYYKPQVKELVDNGMSEEDAIKNAPLMLDTQEMLRKWEDGDDGVISLWKMMNEWVYEGFSSTYNRMGITFDKIYYESQTYLKGKELVFEGLNNRIFDKKEDNSIWVDLTQEGLDEKLLLRSDGTSVYITQDMGTALLRKEDFDSSKLIYVVGNEQNYHFDVLKKVLKKLNYNWADNIYHLSYGMVTLPEGKMKSREGKVVDADDLMEEMFQTAKETTEELGKSERLDKNEANILYEMIGMAAIKYFILKVDPIKNMLFNPKESIDFNGNTGPFIQYTHARIKSLLAKANYKQDENKNNSLNKMFSIEKEIIKLIADFPTTVQDSAKEHNPGFIANYVYELTRAYNQFYQEISIIREEDNTVKQFRLALSEATAIIIKRAMWLLTIEVPERM